MQVDHLCKIVNLVIENSIKSDFNKSVLSLRIFVSDQDKYNIIFILMYIIEFVKERKSDSSAFIFITAVGRRRNATSVDAQISGRRITHTVVYTHTVAPKPKKNMAAMKMFV